MNSENKARILGSLIGAAIGFVILTSSIMFSVYMLKTFWIPL